jgi:hypothetical protein
MFNPKPGDKLRLTNYTNHSPNLQVGIKAPKDQVFVAVLIGMEPRDGSQPLNVEEVMYAMGWHRRPDPVFLKHAKKLAKRK